MLLSLQKPARETSLVRDSSGAIIIMGIPMAMLMIGLLYFVVGLGEQIVLRERMQDAADAAALSAAIMHARGMNMIALINQVMAAIVALLVMVRLFQALMIAVAAIGAALAFWTAGASLAVVPPATSAATQAQNAFEQLRTVTTPILRGLHVFELGLKYGMPLAAEARVVDTVASHYSPPATVGFAIPGHYPLPVEDGQWPELCGKAGEYAGTMIMWPFTAVVGDNIVTDVISGGIGALAEQFSGLFCNPESGASGGQLEIPAELPEIPTDQAFERGFPESSAVRACTDTATEMTEAQREDLCEQASIEEARARPGADGEPNTSCVYTSPRDQQEHACEPCATEPGEACAPFIEKSTAAPSACRAIDDITTWTYQRREFNWRINLVPVPLLAEGPNEDLVIPEDEDLLYTIELSSEVPQHQDRLVDKSTQPPCGEGGAIHTGWSSGAHWDPTGVYGPGDSLCSQPHLQPDTDAWVSEAGEGTEGLPLREWRRRFDDPRWSEHTENYEPARPDDVDADVPWPPTWLTPPYVPEERPYFVGAWAAANFLHGCTATIEDLSELELPEDDTETEQPAGDPNSCGQGSMIHHAMERGHELGDETFQLRAVVLGGTHRDAAREVVERVPFRRRGQARGAESLFSEAGSLASHVFVAQAEYYFDTTWDEGRNRYSTAPEEWMWSMSWRARLRRFRLPVDDEEEEREVGGDAQGCGFEAPSVDVMDACSAADDSCPADFLDQLRALAESVMVH